MVNYLRVSDAKYCLYAIFLVTLGIIALHYLLDAGLSCIDANGCLRSYCSITDLNDDYTKAYNYALKNATCFKL